MDREVTFRASAEGLEPSDLLPFFEGWPDPPRPDRRLQILRSADHVVVALDGDVVVGFVTAISDRIFSAFLPLLEVVPAYRGRGIGSELVRRALAEIGDLYMVDVVCDADLRPFYESLGFVAGTGMMTRNRLANRE